MYFMDVLLKIQGPDESHRVSQVEPGMYPRGELGWSSAMLVSELGWWARNACDGKTEARVTQEGPEGMDKGLERLPVRGHSNVLTCSLLRLARGLEIESVRLKTDGWVKGGLGLGMHSFELLFPLSSLNVRESAPDIECCFSQEELNSVESCFVRFVIRNNKNCLHHYRGWQVQNLQSRCPSLSPKAIRLL